jgi:septum formation protein
VGVENLAGSFDIQGRGALFVKRIEGCYYNVVGLPLAKLALILEEIGMDHLSVQ